jgi:hypothetical protein
MIGSPPNRWAALFWTADNPGRWIVCFFYAPMGLRAAGMAGRISFHLFGASIQLPFVAQN